MTYLFFSCNLGASSTAGVKTTRSTSKPNPMHRSKTTYLCILCSFHVQFCTEIS